MTRAPGRWLMHVWLIQPILGCAYARGSNAFRSVRLYRYGWQTVFVETFDWTNTTSKYLRTVIKGLLQNTQYAYYVKTQNIQNDHNTDLRSTLQGQSNILYFTTTANVPSTGAIETYRKDHSSISMGWYPFSGIRDLITYYRLHVFLEAEDPEFMDQRDYCLEPRTAPHPQKSTAVEVPTVVNEPPTPQSCAAEYKEWVIRHGDSIEAEIEWRMYRQTVCKRLAEEARAADDRLSENRRVYCTDDGESCLSDPALVETAQFGQLIHTFVMSFEKEDKVQTSDDIDSALFERNFVTERFYKDNLTNGTIYGLSPYTLYSFRFYSCNGLGCSPYFLHFDRTESVDAADVIEDVTVAHDSYDASVVHVDFKKPAEPNGLTLTFEIEQRSLDDDNTTVSCITRREHECLKER